MKKLLAAMFVALLMVGCGEEEVLNNKTAEDGPSCEACVDCCASEVESPSKVTDTSKEVQEKALTKVPNREVSIDELEKREGAWYAKGETEPFTGTEIGYYEDGSKSWEVPLVDGKTQGTRIEYYKNGPKKRETTWVDGNQHGLQTSWHENGQKSSETNIKDGRRDGPGRWWYKNGQKRSEGNFKDGKLDGLSTFWSESGEKQLEKNFKDGEPDRLLSRRYENEQKEEASIYKEGKREGLWAELYEKGQKKFEVGKSTMNQSLIELAYASFSEVRGKADAPLEIRARCAFMMGECKFALKDYAGATFLYIETTRKFPSAIEWVQKAFYEAIKTYERSGQSDQIDVVEKQYMEWQRKFLK